MAAKAFVEGGRVMDVGELHWIRPLWLLLIPLVWVLAVLLRSRRRAGGDWAQACDAHLLNWLSGAEAGPNRNLVIWLLAGLLSLALLAAAGPSFERQASASYLGTQARVIILDLSRSMLAEDVKPSRLAQARYKLNDILERIQEGQVGLVTYGGQAFVVSPLTSDMKTIANLIPSLSPDIMPSAGSRADSGLALAEELIFNAGLQTGEILLISDGVNPLAIDKAAMLAKKGITVSVLGVGTEGGAPIPSGNGFLQDRRGSIVITRLDSQQLKRLARTGGGIYQALRADNSEIDNLLQTTSDEFSDTADNRGDRWRDLGPWLNLVLLPFAALAFRRGWLLLLPLILLPLQPARAMDWQDLWQTQDQQAQRALKDGDAERALQSARSPALQAEALYRAGEYGLAADSWSQMTHADGQFNRGNALAQAGDYEQAITAYDEALDQQPGMEDAIANRKLVEDLLKQQQQQQSDESADSEDEYDQQDQQQSESDSSDSSSQQDQSESEQQQNASDQQESDQQQSEQQQQQESEEDQASLAQESQWSEEDEQAMEQWLRRIPDDPSGLLRRKFRAQYQRRDAAEEESQPW